MLAMDLQLKYKKNILLSIGSGYVITNPKIHEYNLSIARYCERDIAFKFKKQCQLKKKKTQI